jgi:hypothetical protein
MKLNVSCCRPGKSGYNCLQLDNDLTKTYIMYLCCLDMTQPVGRGAINGPHSSSSRLFKGVIRGPANSEMVKRGPGASAVQKTWRTQTCASGLDILPGRSRYRRRASQSIKRLEFGLYK